MKSKLSFGHTLGPISANFINKFLQHGKIIFTLNDAANVYGRDKHATGKFLSDLTRRGVLIRIKAGVYLIPQMGQENIQISNWPIIARELVGTNDHFISYYSAMRFHGMTTHALINVYITMTKRCRAKKINNMMYHFIYSKPENFWGGSPHWITKQDKIIVSDLERTILDGLERPDLCGGIKEIIRGIWVKNKEINWDKLVKYAKKFHTKSAVKRLGFILETLDLGVEITSLLAQIIVHARDYIFFDLDGPKEGRYLSRWFIQLNMNIEELKASVWE